MGNTPRPQDTRTGSEHFPSLHVSKLHSCLHVVLITNPFDSQTIASIALINIKSKTLINRLERKEKK